MIRVEPRNANSAIFSYGVPIFSAFIAFQWTLKLTWLELGPIFGGFWGPSWCKNHKKSNLDLSRNYL